MTGNGEGAGNEHFILFPTFSFFPTMFSRTLCFRVIESRVNPFLHIYSFLHTEDKSFRKTLWKKVKLLKVSNFAFFHNVFYGICILKSYSSHISGVVGSFFEFWMVSKWCIREGVKIKSYLVTMDCIFCPVRSELLLVFWH